METGLLSVEMFDGTWAWIQSDAVGAYDVVFEQVRGLPIVVTIATTGPEAAVPAGCLAPEYTVTVPLGGETNIPVGRSIAGVLVGHPAKVVATADGRTLRLKGMEAGRTSVLVRSEAGGDPWLRTVVVAPPAE
jgi:hypothetical protein